jgi:hypothetical protein
MPEDRIVIDISILIDDLRLCVDYAARAGLFRDRDVTQAISAAENTIRSDASPNVQTVTVALNLVVQAIAPVTVADLRFGRDPFSKENQKKSRLFQFWLTVFCLIVLAEIGYSMNALRVEQGVVGELKDLEDLHPELKLTTLRMIAERDQPISKSTGLIDEYHRRVGELKEINSHMSETYSRALEANDIPLFLLTKTVDGAIKTFGRPSTLPGAGPPSVPDDPTPPSAAAGSVFGTAPGSATMPNGERVQTGGASPHLQPTNLNANETATIAQSQDLCGAAADGSFSLPGEATHYPQWMRTVLADTLSDFCFQLKILSPDNQGTLLNQSMSELSFVPHIKDKVSLRVTWFLPFLYGLLGSAVFLMRNVASVRTPAMEWFPIVGRLSLGGVAGIIMGWFAAGASPAIQSTTSLSIPFALAFLTGYGIDVLFSVLDRLNRAIGDVPKAKN